MASKKLWRRAHHEPNDPLVSTPATHADFLLGAQAEDTKQGEGRPVAAQSEVPALPTICEEPEYRRRSDEDATMCTICEELAMAEEDEDLDCTTQSMGNAFVCAICGQLLERLSRGCAHTGHWHEAFEDCGVRCLQLGRNIGRQHWGCCYQVDKNSLICPKARHVPMEASDASVCALEFYSEYHGHRLDHLSQLVRSFRNQGVEELVWLAGDSTLDNKYWLFQGSQPDLFPGATDYTAEAINGYEHVLVPPRMVKDVAYQVNKSLQDKFSQGLHASRRITVVNTSYEEGTLSDRAGDALLPQDAFIRNHIRPQDTLVVSVGGNDVALKPSVKTAISALAMSRMASLETIEAGKATGQGHFYSLFHTETKRYIEKLVARTKPRRVIVCTLYFLDEAETGSWADRVLGHLGYNDDPSRLQAAIRHVFETATSTIEIEGVEVVPVPLFRALDGKTSSDYKSRVEPSVTGGEKMSHLLADAIMR